MTNPTAYNLRENTGTSGVAATARDAVQRLAHFEIPHLLVGGLAVQEHGYARMTLDVDLVVPDTIEAVEFLTSDLPGPFKKQYGIDDRVEDLRNGVAVDFLPAGRVLLRGCKVPFPQPGTASHEIQVASVEDLVSLKLDSWSVSPLRRLRDKTDVVELIIRRSLPRDLNVAEAVRALYLEIWDGLRDEAVPPPFRY